ncbi:MAG: ABC transporter substrate-binding protein [Phycisphaerae bacterium]|nr:ABC transporter substrate-binding protein [Phycisphaerae bacterium]MCZ2400220.1 ABC transporter substrate-binding protein [Phycisphaerae bacterium]
MQRAGTGVRATLRPLRVAYTPDSDDAFNYYAWEHGRIVLDGYAPVFERGHIIALNRLANSGEADVVGVSSVCYPALARQYWILSVGSSVGRGYGPVLAARTACAPADLRGRRIAVGGMPTTGGALALMYCPGAELVEMQYDRIADAVAAGEVDAGVMIHEELLHFEQRGLKRVCDLGAAWCADTGLPLPVGLNLVHRRLGRAGARAVADACIRSLRWAQQHFDEALAFAGRFGRGCARQHVAMFSNEDTACLPGDVRAALRVMFDRVADLRIGPPCEHYEIIDP